MEEWIKWRNQGNSFLKVLQEKTQERNYIENEMTI